MMEKGNVKKAYEALLNSIEVNVQVRKYPSANHISRLFPDQTKGSDLLGKEKTAHFKLIKSTNREHTSGFT